MDEERRLYKRVNLPRLIASETSDHPAYLEDICLGGVQLRNADADDFAADLQVGDTVDIDIEDLSPLRGSVVRIAEPMVAITFSMSRPRRTRRSPPI